MSLTLRENPCESLSPYRSPDMKATLRLKAEDAEDVQELLPPSYLPCLDAKPGANGSWQSAEIPFKDGVRLKSFCIQQKVSSCSILQLAWALVLRCYVGNPSVCFACHTSEGTGNTFDSTASKPDGVICNIIVEAVTPLTEMLKEVEKQSSKAHPTWRKTHTFSTNDGRSPQGVPADTGLLFREDSSQDLPSQYQRRRAQTYLPSGPGD